jgi:hypothetical protein
MAHTQDAPNIVAQRRVARKYEVLGYRVQQNPGPDLLPDFMHGMTPDIVARSEADNVVIEVGTRSSLKGSNNIVGLAERVSGHSDWRLELVVLDESGEGRKAVPKRTIDFERISRTVASLKSADAVSFGYAFASVLMRQIVKSLSDSHGINVSNRTDLDLLSELSFRGIVPDAQVGECLSVLNKVERATLLSRKEDEPSEAELGSLLQLCEQLETLI